MPATPVDSGAWTAVLGALVAIFTILVSILLWQMSQIKNTMQRQGELLFAKMDALMEKKISIDQCSEFRRLCYQHCPFRKIAEGKDNHG